ncbi:monocarboxylate transporter 13-like [Ptychodera flava]|uniref:monocarboxylate transporter 13-like n=1 Tax=Ptychodera flava TaxID=63121 RepID=UPI003969D304
MESNGEDQGGTRDSNKKPSGTVENDTGEISDPWKCLMIICNFVVLSFCLGLNYGLWPLVEGLESYYEEYNYNRDQIDIKWIVYINISMVGITAPVASALVHRVKFHGTRIAAFYGAFLSTIGLFLSGFVRSTGALCATYGVITGIGYGLLLTPCIGLLPMYFRTRYILANAISFTGTSLCIFYVPSLFDYVAQTYGKHSTFIILACLNAQLLVMAALFRPIEQFSSESSPKFLDRCKRLKEKLFSDYEKALFRTIITSMFFIGVGYNILLLHLRQFAMYNGTSDTDSRIVLNVCGVFMIVGQVVHGVLTLSEKVRKDEKTYKRVFYSLSLFGVALVSLLSSVADSFAGHAALAAIIGLGSGMYFPLAFVLLRYSLTVNGDSRLTGALAFGLPIFGIGALIGLPIGDLLNEVTENYDCSFFLAGAALMVVSFTFLLVDYKLRRRESHSRKSTESDGKTAQDDNDGLNANNTTEVTEF